PNGPQDRAPRPRARRSHPARSIRRNRQAGAAEVPGGGGMVASPHAGTPDRLSRGRRPHRLPPGEVPLLIARRRDAAGPAGGTPALLIAIHFPPQTHVTPSAKKGNDRSPPPPGGERG